jgi:predicted DNA-binding protein
LTSLDDPLSLVVRTATKASTHRLDPDIQAALENLSRLLRRPKNRLINEAVKLYVEQKSWKVEHELDLTLRKLRALRRENRNFEGAIGAFVEAEANLSAPCLWKTRRLAPHTTH